MAAGNCAPASPAIARLGLLDGGFVPISRRHHDASRLRTCPSNCRRLSRRVAFGDRQLWRDRLDARGAARALAIAQRYQLPEMLARVIAGRDIEIDAVEDFLDPTIRRLMPIPTL